MSIKSLAQDDRPREKFILKGKESLSDSELLAIIMGSGNREESAVELARKILTSVENSWHRLAQLTLLELMKFKGVGEAKAISIATALEIGRRKSMQELPEYPQIKSSRDAFLILHPRLADLKKEEFWVLFLNNAGRVIHQARCSEGGYTGALVDIRVICRMALEYYATGIIIAHNHPSGILVPSSEDQDITRKINEATKTLDIQLLDHIIITASDYYSFSDHRLL